MPDKDYHQRKSDNFRNTSEFLRGSHQNFTSDANVQDFFYAAVHDAERFLTLFNMHSRSHAHRERIITNYMAAIGSVLVRISDYYRNRARYGVANKAFDVRAEFCYMTLSALRKDMVYGERYTGPLRHTSPREVERARNLFLCFAGSLARHERNLRRLRII